VAGGKQSVARGQSSPMFAGLGDQTRFWLDLDLAATQKRPAPLALFDLVAIELGEVVMLADLAGKERGSSCAALLAQCLRCCTPVDHRILYLQFGSHGSGNFLRFAITFQRIPPPELLGIRIRTDQARGHGRSVHCLRKALGERYGVAVAPDACLDLNGDVGPIENLIGCHFIAFQYRCGSIHLVMNPMPLETISCFATMAVRAAQSPHTKLSI